MRVLNFHCELDADSQPDVSHFMLLEGTEENCNKAVTIDKGAESKQNEL
jgi:hypothetical protein